MHCGDRRYYAVRYGRLGGPGEMTALRYKLEDLTDTTSKCQVALDNEKCLELSTTDSDVSLNHHAMFSHAIEFFKGRVWSKIIFCV